MTDFTNSSPSSQIPESNPNNSSNTIFNNNSNNSNNSNNYNNNALPRTQEQINIQKQSLGSCSWTFLHAFAATFPKKPTLQEQVKARQFIKLFSEFYPCKYCAEDFQEYIEEYPPEATSREALSYWMCEAHNNVNVKIGKPTMDCTEIWKRWSAKPDDTFTTTTTTSEETNVRIKSNTSTTRGTRGTSSTSSTSSANISTMNELVSNDSNGDEDDCGFCPDDMKAFFKKNADSLNNQKQRQSL